MRMDTELSMFSRHRLTLCYVFSDVAFRYSRYSFLPQHLEIHWFSIINSCVTVLLLTGFLATILMRVLKNDFVKYTREEDSAEEQEEMGWKYVHGDVFRFPPLYRCEAMHFIRLLATALTSDAPRKPCASMNSYKLLPRHHWLMIWF